MMLISESEGLPLPGKASGHSLPGKVFGHSLPGGENQENGGEFSSRKSDDLSTTSTEILADALRVPEDGDSDKKNPVGVDNSATKIVGQPILENILESRLPVDTVISCADGKLGAHRLVLAAASPFLGMLFEDQKLGEVAILLLPDIKKNTLEILLHLAYTGTMIFPPEKETDVYAAMECLMFGQMANLDLSMVRIKTPEVVREPQPGTSGAGANEANSVNSTAVSSRRNTQDDQTPSRDTDTRKRRISGSAESRRKKVSKKARFDKDGKRIQIAIRTGAPIGKEGLLKLRRKEEKEIIQQGKYICKAPFLTSDKNTNTVRLNAKRMPLTSIRLRQLSVAEFVCIEVNRQNEWSGNNTGDDRDTDKRMEETHEKEKTTQEVTTDKGVPSNTTPESPEIYKSSGTNSNEDVESGFTEEISDSAGRTQPTKNDGKDTDSSTGSVACSDFDRMDLNHRQRKPRSRRRTGESSGSSRAKSILEIDPYEVLEVISP